ncbi:MAG TPA: type 4a pilus biogenesis protein PilO [Candidatus Dormibacteraeota bacterium]|nr:type 4a pilus biogenesis protein PilO [Candidatus Dormibacteraeota bacterium]
MPRDFTTRKRAILGGVICLVATDLALAYYSFQLASVPLPTAEQIARLERQLKEREAPIARAQKIREDMPNTQRECEKFEAMLLPASSGYSSVSSELGEIAKKSDVIRQGINFKPTPIPERGLTEVAMELTIEGNYRNVILFLNGLQRSDRIYEVESLTLATQKETRGPANVIKVDLHLKTYFRTAA